MTSSQRSDKLPDVPTIAESGIPELQGFEAVGWLGLIMNAFVAEEIKSWGEAVRASGASVN